MMHPIDFVIVTVLEEELDAVLARLPGYKKLPLWTIVFAVVWNSLGFAICKFADRTVGSLTNTIEGQAII